MNAYETILRQIDNIAMELNDGTLQNLMNDAKLRFWKPMPTISFVDIGGTGGRLLQLAEELSGAELPKEVRKKLMGKIWRITVTRAGEGEKNITDEEWEEMVSAGELLLYGTAPALLKYNLVFACVDEEQACSRDLAACEQLYMFTNAAMAMTKLQRQWIEELVKPYYDSDRFYVVVTDLEMLNTDEEEKQVLMYISDVLGDSGTAVLAGESDVMQTLEAACNTVEQLKSQAQRRVLLNAILDMEQTLAVRTELIRTANWDMEEIHRQMQAAVPRLQSAGEIVAKLVLHREFSEVKIAVHDSAQEFSASMCDSICSVIATAGDLIDAEEKIGPYMQYCWQYFTDETNVHLEKAFAHVNSILLKRMEDDVYAVLQTMPEGTRMMLGTITEAELSILGPNSSYRMGDSEALRGFCAEARNAMLLSVPALLISTPLSVAVLLGGIIYGKICKKNAAEAYRETLQIHVENTCREMASQVTREIEAALKKEEDRMTAQIMESYGIMAAQLREQVDRKYILLVSEEEKLRRISSIWREELPALRSSL